MFAVRCVPDDPVKEDAAEDDLMVKSAPLEPLADKFGNGTAFKGSANGGANGSCANVLANGGSTTTTAPGTWVRMQSLLVMEERLCVRVALLATPRSPGRMQSYSLLA